MGGGRKMKTDGVNRAKERKQLLVRAVYVVYLITVQLAKKGQKRERESRGRKSTFIFERPGNSPPSPLDETSGL